MLTILYRGCDKEWQTPSTQPNRPHWFSKINCFNSLHLSLLNSKYKENIKLIVFMDGDKSPMSDFMESCGYDLIYLKFNSGLKSLMYQLNFSNDIDEDIYFLEDDHLHRIDAIDHLYTGVRKFGLVTGWDNMDRYTRKDDITYNHESIKFYEGIHWRTADSTGLSYLVAKEIKQIIVNTQKQLGWQDRAFFIHLYHQYGIRLWQPIPGVSTNIVLQPITYLTHPNHDKSLSGVWTSAMSPGIDWEEINNLCKAK